jgi:uncharacterized membrane protein
MSTTVQQPGLGDQMYEGAAEAGKIYTTIKLVIASVIGIIFLIIGFSLIFSKNKHTEKVTAQITKINTNGCRQINNVNNVNSNIDNRVICDTLISYSYNGTDYKDKSFKTFDVYHQIGDNVVIYVDPNNPSDFSNESKSADRTTGFIFIGFAVFFVGMALFMWWLSRTYKFVGAVEGVSLGANIISGGLGYNRGNMFF